MLRRYSPFISAGFAVVFFIAAIVTRDIDKFLIALTCGVLVLMDIGEKLDKAEIERLKSELNELKAQQ